MFHEIPQAYLERMAYLEEIDARDRVDGTITPKRLRQIPPETGRFLALIASSALPGKWIEVGTSAGYSGLWISLACRSKGQVLNTIEILDEKIRLAQETFRLAGADQYIIQLHGDANELLSEFREVSFCFIDADREHYHHFYGIIVPNMVPGGWLIADNVLSHAEELNHFSQAVFNDPRVDAVLVPIGKGLLVARKR